MTRAEVLDRIIKQSGEMWEQVRPRQNSPVLVKLDNEDGMVFELTLPEGEGHPFWRINERKLRPDEFEDFHNSRMRHWTPEWVMGGLTPLSDGVYILTRGYIYNGRAAYKWSPTIERVRVQVERIE